MRSANYGNGVLQKRTYNGRKLQQKRTYNGRKIKTIKDPSTSTLVFVSDDTNKAFNIDIN